jgi:hypothetical protein
MLWMKNSKDMFGECFLGGNVSRHTGPVEKPHLEISINEASYFL